MIQKVQNFYILKEEQFLDFFVATFPVGLTLSILNFM